MRHLPAALAFFLLLGCETHSAAVGSRPLSEYSATPVSAADIRNFLAGRIGTPLTAVVASLRELEFTCSALPLQPLRYGCSRYNQGRAATPSPRDYLNVELFADNAAFQDAVISQSLQPRFRPDQSP